MHVYIFCKEVCHLQRKRTTANALQWTRERSSSSLSRPIPWPRGSLGLHRWFRNQFTPFSLFCPLRLGELQACPFPDVVFPPLPLSASSSPFHCALQDGFGQTWWMGDITMPLQFASLYNGQEGFVWSKWSRSVQKCIFPRQQILTSMTYITNEASVNLTDPNSVQRN